MLGIFLSAFQISTWKPYNRVLRTNIAKMEDTYCAIQATANVKLINGEESLNLFVEMVNNERLEAFVDTAELYE